MMRGTPRALLLAACLLAACVGVAACGSSDETKPPARAFKLVIGESVPLTGDLADFGDAGKKASTIALREIRNAIKKTGSKQTVKLEQADNQTSPTMAVATGESLVTQKRASCLVGAWANQDTIAIARSVSTNLKVLQISPGSTDTAIADLDDQGYLNRTAAPDSLQAKALADALARALGGAAAKDVSVIARRDAYGRNIALKFAKTWREKGGDISQQVFYGPMKGDYSEETKQTVSGDPDAYIVIDLPETYARYVPQLIETRKWQAAKTWAADGLALSNLADLVGVKATDGMHVLSPGSPATGRASTAFARLYERSSPRSIPRATSDAQSFDATVLCYLAAVAAGSSKGEKMKDTLRDVSGPPGRKFTWEQLPDAVRALQAGDDIDYQGASGPIDLDENGDPTAAFYDVLVFKRGKLEPLTQVPVQTADE
jgi:ABC-type branched-subunit amino acid transport system substrate-binding protein